MKHELRRLKRIGLTQREIAIAFQVSQPTIHFWMKRYGIKY